MPKVLVIGASGFVGKQLAHTLILEGQPTRCLARNPAKVADLAAAGGEVVVGDISDPASLERALESVRAVYISIHTLAPQPASTAGEGFMDVELAGLANIVAACQARGVRRLISVTFLGVARDSPSAWVRGRWQAEQLLLASGLDVTVIRPGMIVGRGGHGFDMVTAQARKAVALVFGGGRQRMRIIALDDLVADLIGVLDDPRTFGRCYDVGSDDILSMNGMIDLAAEVLGRPHPRKMHVPRPLLRLLTPLIERMAKLPRGAFGGLVDSLPLDAIGDPAPIRAILPRPFLTARQAVTRTLIQESA